MFERTSRGHAWIHLAVALAACLLAGALPEVAAARQDDPLQPTRDGWKCAEPSMPMIEETLGQIAEARVARRVSLQLQELGLLCPSIQPTWVADSVVVDRQDFDEYWERWASSDAEYQFWMSLHVQAWEHQAGLFDLIVIGQTKSTWTSEGQLQDLVHPPVVVHWGRSYRSDTVGEFASATVDRLLETWPFSLSR